MSILIKNGRVINPATDMDENADVLIENGFVGKIMTSKSAENIAADRVIDAQGCFVMPGFIDMHVHFRDPGFEQKEDILSGMRAAAHGGYTTVLAMPNTRPVADCADVIEYVKNKAQAGDCINVLQAGSMTAGQKGEKLSDMDGMAKAGCIAVSEDGKSVMNAHVCMEAMREAARLGLVVCDHCEDINLVDGGVVNADSNATRFGIPGITNAVEDVIAARDIILARETGARLHLCHCSTAASVEMVKNAKAHGINVTAEVCPHHFTLTSSDIPEASGIGADPNYKMNPPLRTAEDVKALRQGLSDGTMDVISTDHAPHTAEEKNTSILKSPFGIVGLETVAALTYTELVLGGWLTPYQMAEKMSANPAKILGLGSGDISVGRPADVVIFNPNISYKIDKNKFYSKGRNTPFDGRKVTGRVEYTICGGKVVYEMEGQANDK